MASAVLAFALSLCLPSVVAGYAQNASSSRQPAVIDISPTKASIPLGSPIEIRIRLTNTSDQNINASVSYDRALNISFDYKVQTADGFVLKPKALPKDHAVIGTGKIRSLRPGESAEYMTELSAAEYEIVSPGKYVIQLSRVVSENGKSETVKSNEITITVTP